MQPFKEDIFNKYRNYIYQSFGISFADEKKDVLKSKILKVMKKNNIASYNEYLDMLINTPSSKILAEFINVITVNKTEFFRENKHFEFIDNMMYKILEENIRIKNNSEIRIWCAGCSSGEEAYSIVITLLENSKLKEVKIKLLATDLNDNVLVKAIEGEYPLEISNNIHNNILLKYFERIDFGYRVKSAVKENITFRIFNLMDEFNFKKYFDMIFCRNVMIYFDIKTQQKIIEKFYNILVPGGLLFIGHSESLNNKTHKFRYIEPTIYLK